MNASTITKEYTKTSQTLDETDEALFQQAAKDTIDIQLKAGQSPSQPMVRSAAKIIFIITAAILVVLTLKIWNTGFCEMVPMKLTCRRLEVW